MKLRIAYDIDARDEEDYVETNPTDFSHKAAFGPHRKSTRNHASLPFAQMPDCWQWIQEAPCEEMTRQLTMLFVLTAKRTIEGHLAGEPSAREAADAQWRHQRELRAEPDQALRRDAHGPWLPVDLPLNDV